MWFELRKEDLSFAKRAPMVHVCDATVPAPRSAAFAAISDPRTWTSWWPGVRAAAYPSPPPYGVGTTRAATVGGTRWIEELIAWDEGERWAYTITRSTVPIAHAQIESFELEDAAGGTRVRWTLACEPRLLMRLGAPLAPRVLGDLFQKAMRNLDAHLAGAAARPARG